MLALVKLKDAGIKSPWEVIDFEEYTANAEYYFTPIMTMAEEDAKDVLNYVCSQCNLGKRSENFWIHHAVNMDTGGRVGYARAMLKAKRKQR